MYSEVKATKAEAVAITAAGVRIHLHLDRTPIDYFEQWFRNPKDLASATRLHPRICSFPSYPATGNYIIIEVPEDAAEEAIRAVKEWIPLANDYAKKKNATHEKLLHTLEMKKKAAEAGEKKQLHDLNEKLNRL